MQEDTEEVAVVYQAEYDEEVVWVRDLKVWLETNEVDGEQVSKFRKVE